MNYDEAMNMEQVEFGSMPPQAFLLGLLSAFDNRYQASADAFFEGITWKQFFAIICVNLCKEPPTLNDLSEVMGSSHQNVKQILLKLEKKGFVTLEPDEKDKRKTLIVLTEKARGLESDYHAVSDQMGRLYYKGFSASEIEQFEAFLERVRDNLEEAL